MTPATALVVDDEPMVRHLVRRILEPDICGVVEVEDGETALRLLQRRASSIDVVVTDLAMTGIDGFDVVEVLARYQPTLPVLCMSGYVAQLSATRRLSVPFIHKPFTPETLCEAVLPLIERSRALRAASEREGQRASGERVISEALRAQSEEVFATSVDLV
ncbi:MAG TPA: response regulator, partial [Gemmatimonadales bacterium]|nr:response regulator [Gemmatimonadales bacterium]